ncbi:MULTISPECIES: ABC transporter ATP-binding protein [unclassified Leptolyngbya]|uniref:ABC transporter ATP-binding protein n=1 Tax=unclassified Leptolyngbya TaxID=2650499 RepID=UPI00168532C1|nr:MULTISPECIES: ABC transporter ATP-binding protein [unclassified Leptolyngbya]MBD1911669.1 ABC transporter ATP-binding protein [Leptolyngbya sp. FACHB-8]MBD2154592.1 ABC transporter ATP-binding protein [Leptolyngbya sp. FACHB-16]
MSSATSRSTDELTTRPSRQTDWRLLKMLLPYAARHKRTLALSLVLLIPVSLGTALQPFLVGQAISLIKNEPVMSFFQGLPLRDALNRVALLLLVTIAVRLSLDGMQSYLVQKVGQRITADIRNDLFHHVTSLATRFFDRTPVGKLITRLTSDVDALGDVFSTGAIGIVGNLFSIVVVMVTMFTLQWQLALMLLAILIPITGLIITFQRQFRKANYRAREELSALNATLQENIVGINVVQLFRREAFNSELFHKINSRYVHEVDRTILFDSAVSATLEWISLVAIAAVLWLGGTLVLKDALHIGLLASFILYGQRLFDPLREFAEQFTSIQAGLTALERVSDILNEPIEIRDPAVLSPVAHTPHASEPTIPGEIQFDHVWFGYKSDEMVLRDLTFTIRPGEKVALVGPTGAGKSSIIRLLCRLYDVSQGRILLNGVDIRDLPQAELRRRMTVILQDGFLFAGDVRSNITLGESYSMLEVQKAAAQTNVASFIEQLPQGYNTELRQRGTNLSGGQKQLLAFARAAIRNPGILVLDEATANLDVGTEALIQEALDTLLVDRTAIIIAHRLSTIRRVDRILVLKHGQLVESGNHDELLAMDGLYASLYRLQMLEA